jgi:hypothetical protein
MEYPSLCEINCGEGGVDLNEEGDRLQTLALGVGSDRPVTQSNSDRSPQKSPR